MAASSPSSAGPPAGFESERVLRSVAGIDVLLLVLALLYFAAAAGQITRPALYLGACFGYAALLLALRRVPILVCRSRERLLPVAVVMVAFITAVQACSGDHHTPLFGLYLLPISIAALTLGRGTTVGIVALALAGRLSLDVFSLAYALRLLTEAVPVVLVAVLMSSLAASVADSRAQLQVMSDRDDLTGLLNLQAFMRLVEEERARAIRRGTAFSLLLVNIDGLKLLNAHHGSAAGDRALVAVAEALRRSTRPVDLVARYGGDEFIVFLAGAGAAIARGVANRIRHNVGTMTVELDGAPHHLSVGIGAGVFPADGRELRDLTNAAGRAIDKDKESRRPAAPPAPQRRHRTSAEVSMVAQRPS